MTNKRALLLTFSFFGTILIVLFSVVAYAAPISNVLGNILPIQDSLYDLGTTTAKFNRGFFNFATTSVVSVYDNITIGRTSTTTIYGNAATSTFSGGIILSAGCFRDLSGSCITSGVSTYLALSDTQASFTANRIIHTNSGATALTDTAGFVFDGTSFGIGSTSPGSNLSINSVGNFAPVTSSLYSSLTLPFLTSTSTTASTFAGSITASGGLTLTCTACLTDTNVADDITLTNITQITNRAITDLTGTLGLANGGTNNTAFSPGMVIVSGASSLNATSSLLTVGQLNATTTATSTFAGGVSVLTLNASSASATSTFSNGIQLAGGCFRDINGSCLTAGGAGTPGGSDGQIQYNNSSVFGGATFFFLDDTNNRIGIATTTPNLSFTMGSSTPAYNPEVIEPWRATVTVNLNNGNHFKVILAGATTLTLSNGWAGQTADITICQDTTGGRTITAYTNPILWPGATTTLSEGVSKCNLLGILVSSGTSTQTYNVTGLITGY